jgi:glycosyltransferase involved in cell wall biosynthesis
VTDNVKLQKHILYITYDGLTDPLGQSQILPYIKGLSQHGYRFTLLSFEKKERYEKNKELIQQSANASNIHWVPLPFTTSPPLLSKFYDAMRMRTKAKELHLRYRFDMVHCRSYIAADVGLYMKKKFGTKFFFDMRGFWADEKRDGGHWNDSHPIKQRDYQYYKQKEKADLQNADYVISLTESGKREMTTWPYYDSKIPLQVIPCCADMNLFSLTSEEQKKQGREALGIPGDILVFSYLGSVGLWYMLTEMLQFFKQAKQTYPAAVFLFITPTPPSVIEDKATEVGVRKTDLIIREAARREVPGLIKASDINVSFIRPVYSKISSSPTKLGEVLAMGIPVISNSGVGDVEEIVEGAAAGYILHQFLPQDFDKAIAAIPGLLKKSPLLIRQGARPVYSLEEGIKSYSRCYQQLFA